MIDPGHPFSVPYADVIAALEDRLRNGTEQSAQWQFVFQSARSTYELPRDASAITSVSGFVGQTYTEFEPDVHYRLASNRLVWIDPDVRPRDVSRVDVEYTYHERPSGLTDFNEGSVAGTLIRAVAREVKVVYEQMDQAYRRAFIDVATGSALDSVVALLGIVRNPAIKARGPVTYVRRTATNREVVIPAGQRVAAPGGRTFVTLAAAVIPVERDEFGSQLGGVVRTTDKIATLVGVWPRDDDPDADDPLPTEPTAPDQPFGEDERAITLAAPLPTEELRIRYQPKSVTVEAEAVEAGPEGNLDAGSITVMPTPPTGVNGVINEAAMQGGREAEPDDQLRERAKHALERAGNATLNALRFGVLDVDGIDEVEVVDHAADAPLALGEVRLRYSASGDLDEVERNVNATVAATRAAGIRVVAELIETVLVSGTFYLVPDAEGAAGAEDRFLAAVIAEIDALGIGAPLSPRRLSSKAYQVGGLADVAEAQLRAKGDPIGDPYVVTSAQLVRPDEEDLRAVLLRALHVSATRAAGATTEIDLQLVDEDGTPLAVAGSLTLGVAVELAARRKTAPDQPPVRVGNVTRDIVFSAAPKATLVIDPAGDAPGFDDAIHQSPLTATIAAAAYPGLQTATAEIPVS
jgi:uncharacterized phage protein gp47/JayE